MFEMKCYYGTFKNKRENNEDNFYINSVYAPVNHNSDIKGKTTASDSKQAVFGVFDGLGGEEKGETASYTAAKTLKSFKDIKKYYFAANKAVANLTPGRTGRSGSTAVIFEFSDGTFQCSNLGDSRGYLIRNGKIYRLSRDHTTIQTLIENGTLTEEEAKKSRFKNSLSQCLGPEEEDTEISPYYSKKGEIKEGDIFLLCSDGLTGNLTDDEIRDIVLASEGGKAVETLFKRAEAAGAKDNTTIVLIYAKKENGAEAAPAAANKTAPKQAAPKRTESPKSAQPKPAASAAAYKPAAQPKKSNSSGLIIAGAAAACIVVCCVVLYFAVFNKKTEEPVSETETAEASEKAGVKTQEEAFQDILDGRVKSCDYVYYDIDKDGTEELVLGDNGSSYLEVYVYDPETGEAKALQSIDMTNNQFEENYLFDYEGGLGCVIKTNDTAVQYCCITIENGIIGRSVLAERSESGYKIDINNVSEADYNSYIAQIASNKLESTHLSGADPSTTTTETTTETTTQASTEAATRSADSSNSSNSSSGSSSSGSSSSGSSSSYSSGSSSSSESISDTSSEDTSSEDTSSEDTSNEDTSNEDTSIEDTGIEGTSITLPNW
ncbi:MAG: serine/threonine-protein phosphatase [Clostridiales bacterium]|nr:serine/threonine-protein phosphatase [Clostridiales bacterium]